RKVPDVAALRRAEIAVGVANEPAALAEIRTAAIRIHRLPDFLDDVGGVGGGGVRVAVEADVSIDVEIVEDDEVLRERVSVRRDVAPEARELRIAVAFAQVAENLIVGAVLANDVEDVLDGRAAADDAWNRRSDRHVRG